VEFVAVDGFVPADGEDFTFLLTGGSRSGEFSSLELGDFACPSESTCTDVYGSNFVEFEINPSGSSVPEPDMLLLFGAGLLTLPIFTRRRLRRRI
jgi:hypothetical protein